MIIETICIPQDMAWTPQLINKLFDSVHQLTLANAQLSVGLEDVNKKLELADTRLSAVENTLKNATSANQLWVMQQSSMSRTLLSCAQQFRRSQ